MYIIPSLIIPIFWLVFIVYWIISAIGAKKSLRTAAWWKGAIFRALIAVVLVVALNQSNLEKIAKNYSVTTGSSALGYIGVVLCALGIAWAIWARRHLGRNWGMPMTTKGTPELVTSGPYSYTRHPIYTGMLLAALGSGLAAGLPWLIMFFIFSFYFTYSAVTEEKNMTKLFPNEYPQYKQRTKMLIPFIF